MLSDITPVVLTYNEAPNIGRTLSMLTWASRIVLVDSGSSDDTLEIARSFPQVQVFERPFDSHAAQWNYALTATGITSAWVLALDADYVLSEALVRELENLQPTADVGGFEAGFEYCIFGKALRGSTYGRVVVLYRRDGAHYEQDGHTQRVRVRGRLEALTHPVRHDDRKSVSQWCAAQNRYMALEAEKLLAAPRQALTLADRIRRTVVLAPLLMFIYCAFVKGNVLDGRAGLYYIRQRVLAEMLLSLHLMHRRLSAGSARHAGVSARKHTQ